jgi:tetratricopeptide (TPR) repeat protein
MARLDETVIAFQNPIDQLEKGIECCRKGDWETGFAHLSAVAARQTKPGELPSRYYSYLGYGMALKQKRFGEGIKLCRYAIKQEFYQIENYANLARTYLLAKRKGDAYKAIKRGLKVDPDYPELQELHRKLGARQNPVLPFLSRGNVFNNVLGRIRHALKSGSKKAAPANGPAGSKTARKAS